MNALAEHFFQAVDLAIAFEVVGQEQIGLVEERVQAEALFEGGQRLFVLAGCQQGIAPFVPEVGGIGAEGDGCVVQENAAVQPLLANSRLCTVQVGPGAVEARQIGGVVGVERVDPLGLQEDALRGAQQVVASELGDRVRGQVKHICQGERSGEGRCPFDWGEFGLFEQSPSEKEHVMVFGGAGRQRTSVELDAAQPVGLAVELLPLFVDNIGFDQIDVDRVDQEDGQSAGSDACGRCPPDPASGGQPAGAQGGPGVEGACGQHPGDQDEGEETKVAADPFQLEVQKILVGDPLWGGDGGQPGRLDQPIDQPDTPDDRSVQPQPGQPPADGGGAVLCQRFFSQPEHCGDQPGEEHEKEDGWSWAAGFGVDEDAVAQDAGRIGQTRCIGQIDVDEGQKDQDVGQHGARQPSEGGSPRLDSASAGRWGGGLAAPGGWGGAFGRREVAFSVGCRRVLEDRQQAHADHHQHGNQDPEVRAGRPDCDPEVNFQIMGHDSGEQGDDDHQPWQVAAIGLDPSVQEGCQCRVAAEAGDDAEGQPQPGHAQLPAVGGHQPQRTGDAEAGDQERIEQGVAALGDQAQPAQRPVKDRHKQGDVTDKAEQPGDDDAVPGLVVRAVRAGVARFDMGQLGGVEGIECDPHGFRPIADEWAQHVDPILAAVWKSERFVGQKHFGSSSPDQLAYFAGAAFCFKDIDKASNVRGLLQKLEGRNKIGGQDEQHQPHRSCQSQAEQRTKIAWAHGAHGQQDKQEDARDPAQPGATALCPDEGDALHQQHEEVGAASQGRLPIL